MGIAAATPATASPADTAAPVHVDASRWTTQGRWVTDAQHRVVITQGINVEGVKLALIAVPHPDRVAGTPSAKPPTAANLPTTGVLLIVYLPWGYSCSLPQTGSSGLRV